MQDTGERYMPDSNDPAISYEHWHRYLYASQFVRGKKVLDIGCGMGYGCRLMAETARNVVGLDFNADAVAFAEQAYAKDNIKFIRMEAQAMGGYGKERFDVITVFETIEHLEEEAQNAVLQNVKKCLKPSGICIISTPNRLVYGDATDHANPFHKKEFYVQEFENLLKQYFKSVALLGQKIFAASYIWPGDKRQGSFVEYEILKTDKGFMPVASPKSMRYMLGVCSDAGIDDQRFSVLVDTSEDLLRHKNELIQHYRVQLKKRADEMIKTQEAVERAQGEIQAKVAEVHDKERVIAVQKSALEHKESEKTAADKLLEEKIQALAVAEKSLLNKEALLIAKENTINEALKKLFIKNEECAGLVSRAQAAAQEVSAKDAAIKEKDRLIEAGAERARTAEEARHKVSAQLAEAEKTIAANNSLLEQQTVLIRTHMEHAEKAEKENTRLAGLLSSGETKAAEQGAALTRAETLLEATNSRLVEAQKAREGIRTELRARLEEILIKDKTIAEGAAELARRQQRLQEREVSLQKMQHAIDEKQADLNAVKQNLADMEKRLAKNKSMLLEAHLALASKEEKARGARTAMREQALTIGELYKTVSIIRASFSYKAGVILTFPVRLAYRKIKALMEMGYSVGQAEAGTVLDHMGKAFSHDYEKWAYRNRLTKKLTAFIEKETVRLKQKPVFSIIMPVYNTPAKLLLNSITSVTSQIYPLWELCVTNDGSDQGHVDRIIKSLARQDKRIKYKMLQSNRGIPEATNASMEMASGQYVMFMDHDDVLEKDALFHVAQYLNEHPEADFIYTDDDVYYHEGNYLARRLKPDWAPEFLFSHAYISHLAMVKKDLLVKTGYFNPDLPGSQDHDFFMRVAEATDKICHVPMVLYHVKKGPHQFSAINKSVCVDSGLKALNAALIRRGIDWAIAVQPDRAKVKNSGFYKLNYNARQEDRISVIIHAGHDAEALMRGLESIEHKTRYRNFELIIVCDKDIRPEEFEQRRLAAGHHTVLKYDGPKEANTSRPAIMNWGARHAQGDFIVFLSNKAEILTPEWLEAMLVLNKLPGVGIVGAKITGADGKVGHAGKVVLFYPNTPDMNVKETIVDMRNWSAVSAECMMIRKEVFAATGGFDAKSFPKAYYDVDLCLRAKTAGYRAVYTPYADVRIDGLSTDPRENRRHVMEHINLMTRHAGYTDGYLHPVFRRADFNGRFVENAGFNSRTGLCDISSAKQNILSVTHNLELEGAPKNFLEINKFLRSKGMNVRLVSLADGLLAGSYRAEGIPVEITGYNREDSYEMYEKWIRGVIKQIKDKKINLVIANTKESFAAIEAAHRAGIPSVWIIRESVDYENEISRTIKDSRVSKMAMQAFVKANRLVFVSLATKRLFERYDYYKTAQIIYNGIDTKEADELRDTDKREVRRALGLPEDKKIVAIVGTVAERKGQVDFAKAAVSLFRGPNSNTLFLIIGNSEKRPAYTDRVRQNIGDNGNIVFVDATEKISLYYKAMDIFVCASYNESLPQTILEAMAFSLPIVTTDVFGISEQIVHEQTGLVCRAGDVNKLADNIKRLLEDRDLCARLGGNARKAVETYFPKHKTMHDFYRLACVAAFEDINEYRYGPKKPLSETITAIRPENLKGSDVKITAAKPLTLLCGQKDPMVWGFMDKRDRIALGADVMLCVFIECRSTAAGYVKAFFSFDNQKFTENASARAFVRGSTRKQYIALKFRIKKGTAQLTDLRLDPPAGTAFEIHNIKAAQF